MMHTLVKRITDDEGEACEDDRWHLIGLGDLDTIRVLCTGEAYDGASNLVLETKQNRRGGITCSKCLEIVKEFKAIKL